MLSVEGSWGVNSRWLLLPEVRERRVGGMREGGEGRGDEGGRREERGGGKRKKGREGEKVQKRGRNE